MSDLRPGDLVEITRASVLSKGVPAGTVALIMERYDSGATPVSRNCLIFIVQPVGEAGKRWGRLRYLDRDIERLTRT